MSICVASTLLGRVVVTVHRAAAERVRVQRHENQRRDERVHDVIDRQLAELAALDAALDRAAEQVVSRDDHLVDVELRDLRKVAHFGDHDLADARSGLAAEPFPPRAQQQRQQFGRRSFELLGDLRAFGDQRRHVVAHHRLEELFLARVVQIQRALRHAGARGNLFGTRGRKAFFDEQLERGVEQFLRARFLAALACGGGDDGGQDDTEILTNESVM